MRISCFLSGPPASSRRTRLRKSSVRRAATTHPAEPAPTMMKSCMGKALSLPFEKLLDGCHRQGGVFLVWHMPEVAEDDKLTSRNVAMKSLTTLRQDEPVASTPKNQRGQPQLRNALCVRIRRSLGKTLYQRAPIALPDRHGIVELDELRRHLAGVAVNIAHTCFDDAAWQREPGKLIERRQAGNAKADRNRGRLLRISSSIYKDEFWTRSGAASVVIQATYPPNEFPPSTQCWTPSRSNTARTNRT